MSEVMSIQAPVNLDADASRASRYLPEPATQKSNFGEYLELAADNLLEIGSVAAGVGLDGGTGYAALIAAQIKAQQEMMIVSMDSNIKKSEHEAKMAPVRNIRVG